MIAQGNVFFDGTTAEAFGVPKTERDQCIERMRAGFGNAQHEKLKSVPDAQQYFNVGVTVEQLDPFASRPSDYEADLALQHARRTLFQTISQAGRTRA